MLETLAAFGFACNILQCADVAAKALALLGRISEDNHPDASLAEYSRQLTELSATLLQHRASSSSADGEEKAVETKLTDAATKCQNVSAVLLQELDKISTGKFKRVGVFVRYITKREKIRKLEQELSQVKSAIESWLLVDARMKAAANRMVEDVRFTKFDTQLQALIRQVAESSIDLTKVVREESDSTRSVVQVESIRARHYIDERFDKQEEEANASRAKSQLLASLRFDTMDARFNDITVAHQSTFRWAFDHDHQKPWDSFSWFLASKDKLYWVSGKAGSGKSVLMKYLVTSSETLEALKSWEPEVIIISYFIFNAGTPAQRSIKSMLCALLYQLLDHQGKTIASLLSVSSITGKKYTPQNWSVEELKIALATTFQSCQHAICVFIDGLDEIDEQEGPIDLLCVVRWLQSFARTKLCVSSRPEQAYRDAFETSAKQLHLQDLTKEDVRNYVLAIFQEYDPCVENAKVSGIHLGHLADEIVYKADGVFLWAHLVARDLREGISAGDYPEMLDMRLAKLPRGLFNLYKAMWSRLGENEALYGPEAAFFFKCVLEANRPMTLFNLAFTDRERRGLRTLDCVPSLTEGGIIEYCARTKSRIQRCCVGLIEFRAQPVYLATSTTLTQWVLFPFEEPKDNSATLNQRTKTLTASAQFSHRSAKQFLLETEEGRSILDCDRTSPESRLKWTLSATIGEIALGLEDFIYLQHVFKNARHAHDLFADCQKAFNFIKEKSSTLSAREVPAWLYLYPEQDYELRGLELSSSGSHWPRFLQKILNEAAKAGATQLLQQSFASDGFLLPDPDAVKSRLIEMAINGMNLYEVELDGAAWSFGENRVGLSTRDTIIWLLESGADPNCSDTTFAYNPFAQFIKQASDPWYNWPASDTLAILHKYIECGVDFSLPASKYQIVKTPSGNIVLEVMVPVAVWVQALLKKLSRTMPKQLRETDQNKCRVRVVAICFEFDTGREDLPKGNWFAVPAGEDGRKEVIAALRDLNAGTEAAMDQAQRRLYALLKGAKVLGDAWRHPLWKDYVLQNARALQWQRRRRLATASASAAAISNGAPIGE